MAKSRKDEQFMTTVECVLRKPATCEYMKEVEFFLKGTELTRIRFCSFSQTTCYYASKMKVKELD